MTVIDGDELNKPMEGACTDASHPMTGKSSGHGLLTQFGQITPQLPCFSNHEFGGRGVHIFQQFFGDVEAPPIQGTGEVSF